MIQAKELFVNDLIGSGLDYAIIRPTGFFSDMLEFLNMAKKGRVSLFGSGENKINPIHGSDLAEVCVESITVAEKEVEIGGPNTYSFREIGELAFKALNKPQNISTLPTWICSIILSTMRVFTSSKVYGPLEFMMSITTMDVVGPSYGKESLVDFFGENTKN